MFLVYIFVIDGTCKGNISIGSHVTIKLFPFHDGVGDDDDCDYDNIDDNDYYNIDVDEAEDEDEVD